MDVIFWLGWVRSTVCGSGGRWSPFGKDDSHCILSFLNLLNRVLLAVLKCLKDKVKWGRLGLSSVVQREAKERYYILIWLHKAWIKVLLLALCLFDIGTSEDQLSFKGVSCETSHWHLLSSNWDSFYLLNSRGAHWASGRAKDLMPTIFQCQLFVA